MLCEKQKKNYITKIIIKFNKKIYIIIIEFPTFSFLLFFLRYFFLYYFRDLWVLCVFQSFFEHILVYIYIYIWFYSWCLEEWTGKVKWKLMKIDEFLPLWIVRARWFCEQTNWILRPNLHHLFCLFELVEINIFYVFYNLLEYILVQCCFADLNFVTSNKLKSGIKKPY